MCPEQRPGEGGGWTLAGYLQPRKTRQIDAEIFAGRAHAVPKLEHMFPAQDVEGAEGAEGAGAA